jgi:isochorismate hydrolase
MFDPSRAALLVMDIQHDIVAIDDDRDALPARVEQVRARCRQQGMLVVTKQRVGAFAAQFST